MNKAVILCGGLGTRLRPITYKIPKPLIKIGDKPLLEYLINVLKRSKVTEIYLAVSYLGKQIEEYFTRCGFELIRAENVYVSGFFKENGYELNLDEGYKYLE